MSKNGIPYRNAIALSNRRIFYQCFAEPWHRAIKELWKRDGFVLPSARDILEFPPAVRNQLRFSDLPYVG
jgi:hypothetical protein